MASNTAPYSKTTLFIDKLSQPSRAVLWFCLNQNIPDFEVKLVQIRNNEQKSPEFLRINPVGKVPAINDKGFCIGESTTIVRYLADKYGGSNWIPKDLQQRARVDALLDDHHNSLRQGASRIFWFEFMMPTLNMPVNPVIHKHFTGVLKGALKGLETIFSKEKYLAGELSFADMMVYSELRQLELTSFDLSPWPNVCAWMKLMTQVPHHDAVFDVLEKLKASAAKKKAAKL
jgi:glutathione S-transferase